LLLRDVTEKRRLLEQLELQAHTDPLTGLLNRRQLDAEAQRLILLASRHATPLSLAVLDLDNFKKINDTHGHHAGDNALRQVAKLLIDRLRTSDVVGRIGGDEFVALLPGTGTLDAAALMNELRESFQAESALTLSIGVAELSSGHPDLNALLSAADISLYEAKRGGRNRVEYRELT
jgi:diguanylate cyclase (GGDEF)-like protein